MREITDMRITAANLERDGRISLDVVLTLTNGIMQLAVLDGHPDIAGNVLTPSAMRDIALQTDRVLPELRLADER